MGHRHRSHSQKSTWLWLALLGLCAAALVILVMTRPPKGEETFGDLESRFTSTVRLEYGGKTWSYRDREIVNVLVLGVDRGDVSEERKGYRSGGQADFLLLMSIDRRNKKITPIQIDRDTIAEIEITGVLGNPAGTARTQICLAQAFGATVEDSCKNEVRAVSRLLSGVPIDYYLALDLASINLINDALGGVEVTVEDDLTAMDPNLTIGKTLVLQGNQAETFVRSRRGVASDPTNVGRMRRQKAYMLSAAEKLTAMLSGDPAAGARILEKLGSHIVTDIPQSWLTDQLPEYSAYERLEVWTPDGAHIYGSDGFAEFYPDSENIMKMLIETYFA